MLIKLKNIEKFLAFTVRLLIAFTHILFRFEARNLSVETYPVC